MISDTTTERTNIASFTEDQRIETIERVIISFPRLAGIREKIDYCRRHSKIAAEPECLLITGSTGAGKTTLCREYVGRFPRRPSKAGITVPVLSASIPVPATVKSLVTRLLFALGDPLADRGTVVNQTMRLHRLIGECQVEIILLDEFQHFIDRDSNHILLTVSNWLKELLNETNIPMILIGMPYSDVILQSNAQLERRFQMREQLSPFGYADPAQQTEFRTFLRYLDEALPLAESSHLSDVETAFRIFCATGGAIGHVMKLIRRAAVLAVTGGMNKLDLELLAEVYDERFSASRTDPNPFRADPEHLRVEPLKDLDSTDESFGRHSPAKAEAVRF
jgi:hypothetical protein